MAEFACEEDRAEFTQWYEDTDRTADAAEGFIAGIAHGRAHPLKETVSSVPIPFKVGDEVEYDNDKGFAVKCVIGKIYSVAGTAEVKNEFGHNILLLAGQLRHRPKPAEKVYPFTPGDVVYLKSGGCAMVVEDIDAGGKLECAWHIPDGHVESAYFPAACLTRIRPEA